MMMMIMNFGGSENNNIHQLESFSPGSVLEHKAKVNIQSADTGNRRYSSALGRFFRHLPCKGTDPPWRSELPVTDSIQAASEEPLVSDDGEGTAVPGGGG